jgi:hypothetical protein
MEELIRKVFFHVDVIGPFVAQENYDLIGPDGAIILPQVWEDLAQPDWSITMHMWPMSELPVPLPPARSYSGRTEPMRSKRIPPPLPLPGFKTGPPPQPPFRGSPDPSSPASGSGHKRGREKSAKITVEPPDALGKRSMGN